MRFFCRKRLTINDLNTVASVYNRVQRERFKIAIIDDEDFVYLERLRNLGFNITKYDDIHDLNMLESYDIIISDIKGVGKSFNSDVEGAFILHELKKKYPYKEFAAYTGSAFDIKINNYLSGIQIIKKDFSIEEWTSAIDLLIHKISNPKQIWKKMRATLLEKDIPLLDLVDLEDEFVDAIVNHGGNLENFPSVKTQERLSPDVIRIISSITTSLLTKFIITTTSTL